MNVLGLIPARKNSRRLPGKNIRRLAGKPLIVWTIEAAKQSKLITHLVCSTDDERVMEVCRDHHVDILVRPAHLATDEARSEDVVLHALEFCPCDYVCLLQPTSPLRLPEDIDRCINEAIQWGPGCVTRGPRGLNGALYVASSAYIKARHAFYLGHDIRMPEERSVDIDDEHDWRRAEGYADALWLTA